MRCWFVTIHTRCKQLKEYYVSLLQNFITTTRLGPYKYKCDRKQNWDRPEKAISYSVSVRIKKKLTRYCRE